MRGVANIGSWTVTANADNAAATATKAADSNTAARHYITSISGSFSAAVAGKLMTLKQGATEKGRWYVHNALVLAFDSPIELDANTAAELELAASGSAGQIGAVTMTGYTL